MTAVRRHTSRLALTTSQRLSHNGPLAHHWTTPHLVSRDAHTQQQAVAQLDARVDGHDHHVVRASLREPQERGWQRRMHMGLSGQPLAARPRFSAPPIKVRGPLTSLNTTHELPLTSLSSAACAAFCALASTGTPGWKDLTDLTVSTDWARLP